MLRFVRLLLPFVVAGIAGIMPVASAAAAASVAPDAFFRHPDHADFKLSPSGKYLAGLVPVQGRVRLSVLDLDAKTASVVGSVDGEDVATFEWVNDRRLVFSAMDLQAGLGEQRGGGLYAINRDGTESRVLAPTVRQLIARGQVAPRYTALHGVLRDGSADVMVIANDRSARYPGIYRMDTLTAKKTWVGGEVPGDVVGWVVDRKGVARAAVTEEKKGLAARTWWRPTADAAWVALGEYGLAEPHVAPVAFDGDGSLIVAANQGRDTLALYHYDTDKKTLGNVLAAHPQADLERRPALRPEEERDRRPRLRRDEARQRVVRRRLGAGAGHHRQGAARPHERAAGERGRRAHPGAVLFRHRPGHLLPL